MKKLLFPVLAILMVTAGCIPGSPITILPANESPTANIKSISPVKASPGEAVTFEGHGVDTDGEVVAYQWWSGLDGELSTSKAFKTSSLSEGTHDIWFRVQDDSSDWSEKIFMRITVFPSGIVPTPVINTFDASSGSIFKGNSVTLSWEVTDAATVTVEPGIGAVALTGSRVVSPAATTRYTLTATNKAGSTITEAEVMVVSRGRHTVELFSIAAEDGHVRKDGAVGPELTIGDTDSNIAMQAFLSFDISTIPAAATIKSSSLDLGGANIFGHPFDFLGVMGVFNDQYGELDSGDFVGPPLLPRIRRTTYTERFPMTEAMYTFSSLPPFSSLSIESFGSSALTNAIQKRVDASRPRFQIRVQFEKYFFYNDEEDYLVIMGGRPKLVIEYED